MKNALPALIIVALLGIVVVAGVSQFAFNNIGVVAIIQVNGFLEAACTTPLTSLTWPPIAPGDTAFKLIYVNSTGTVPAVLNLTTVNWNPTYAKPLIMYAWDLEGVTILPNSILQANLTLTLAADMGNVTSFDFTAIINAEETT